VFVDGACLDGGGVCGEGMFVCVEWCVHDVLDVCVEDICRVWCVYMRVCFYGWCLLVYLCGEFVSLEGVCGMCVRVSVWRYECLVWLCGVCHCMYVESVYVWCACMPIVCVSMGCVCV